MSDITEKVTEQLDNLTVNETPAAASAAAATTTEGSDVPENSTSSLYVGELNPEVNEALLFDLFSPIGMVASIRVCRDAVTNQSLGYAYVNFQDNESGARAAEQLNFTPINGRPCRIMSIQRDPSKRRQGDGNVFIKNLDPAIDNKALYDTFSVFGKILSCKVAVDVDGQSKGFGFVHFEDPEAANDAIESINGMPLNGKELYVGLHVSRKERQAKLDDIKKNFTNIYIKNIPLDVTQEEFTELFSKIGPTFSCALALDDESKSKGFGFVNYEKHEDAVKAIEELNDFELKGSKLYVGRAQKKFERAQDLQKQYEVFKNEKLEQYKFVNLFIKNLADSIDDEQLNELFAPFGTITSAKVMKDENNNSKGFGFVCYSTREEAQTAISEMHQKMVLDKPLYVVIAKTKEERRAEYLQQRQAKNRLRFAGAPGVGPHHGMPNMMAKSIPQQQMMYNMYAGGAPMGQFTPQFQRGFIQPQMIYPMQQQQQQQQQQHAQQFNQQQAQEARKRALGQPLFEKVQVKTNNDEQASSRITGMLLETSEPEVLQMLQDEAFFEKQFSGAKAAYDNMNSQQAAAAAAAAAATTGAAPVPAPAAADAPAPAEK
ncbi:hypothetical protein ACO0QE_002819 [Hanseniaspora vineae]